MNPFTLQYSHDYFCDRTKEISVLRENIENGRNTLVHSPRRLGKSAMIKYLFYGLGEQKQTETLFIDLFATTDMEGLIRVFAENILLKYHRKNFITGVKTLLKGISPNISFSPDGTPSLGLSINESQQETTLHELFCYLESRKKPIVIAFDEFQEVANYPEKAEAILRTHIQNLKNVRFIFSGSSNHLLREMFFGAKRPFYQSAELMMLDKIDREMYASFIKENFNKFGKKAEDDSITYLLDFSDVYTYYTQSVCNQAFSKTDRCLTRHDAVEICSQTIENRKDDYQSLLRLFTENQRKVIIAVAKEEIVAKPAAIGFIIKHKLPSASSVVQAVKSMEEKEVLYRNQEGVTIYDVFLKRFLQRYY